MKKLSILLIAISALVNLSCKEDEPSGPVGALGKSFNLAHTKVKASIASRLIVSTNGTNIVSNVSPNGNDLHYSSDGGNTFAPLPSSSYISGVDNQGNILTQDNKIINATNTNINIAAPGGETLILGDNGKVFSLNINTPSLKQRNIASGEFTNVTLPFTPGAGITFNILKAPGKGILCLTSSGTDERSITAWLLDETTLEWSTETNFSYTYNNINGCNNLNRYARYSYASNNIIIAKGCSGVALLDLTSKTTSYINFPEQPAWVYEDVRDGQIYLDSKKQIYIVTRTWDDLTTAFGFKYDGNNWSGINDFLPVTNTYVFAADQSGNIYYNSVKPGSKSLKGAIKLNASSNEYSGLDLPQTGLTIDDAAEFNNHLLMVVDGSLYDHDISAGTTTEAGLENVSHINILSDGRWLAGGMDRLYLSNDHGKTWKETKNIFSSLDNDMEVASVKLTRIVNNKILILGVFHYQYYHQTTGVMQDMYDNMMIEFDGSNSTSAPYQFPNSFEAKAIGPDGKLYGDAIFYGGFSFSIDRYVIAPNTTPFLQTLKEVSPQIITDGGLQMSVGNRKSAAGFEVVTRNSDTEAFQSSNTPLPGDGGSYEGLFIRLAGDRIVFVNRDEVYITAN